jgi:hypothetical protein
MEIELPGYSDEFEAFLKHCLASNPDERLAVENRRHSWAARFEKDGQDDLLKWIRETSQAA